MARGFDTTFGAASTDKIVTSYVQGSQTTNSLFLRVYVSDTSTAPRFIVFGTDVMSVFASNSTGSGTDDFIRFLRAFNAGANNGQWDSAASSLTLNVWNTFGLKYDQGSASNDPTFYINGSKATVGSGLTESATPSGTADSIVGISPVFGNRSAGDRVLHGILAEAAIWNVLLDDNEFFALNKGYSPASIRPTSLTEYVPMLRANVSYKVAAPTLTGTAVQPHPRIIMSRKNKSMRYRTAPTTQLQFVGFMGTSGV